jgi:hypothetical protein
LTGYPLLVGRRLRDQYRHRGTVRSAYQLGQAPSPRHRRHDDTDRDAGLLIGHDPARPACTWVAAAGSTSMDLSEQVLRAVMVACGTLRCEGTVL